MSATPLGAPKLPEVNRIVGLALDGEAPWQGAGKRGVGPIERADLAADVLQIGDVGDGREVFEPPLGDEPARGEDAPDPRCVTGGPDIAGASGEIEHHWDPSRRVQGEHRDHQAKAGRQENAHVFARRGDPAQAAAEREGAPDQVGVAERTPVLVLDDPRPAAVRVTGVDERVEQRASALGRDEVQRRSLFHQAP